MDVVNDTDSLRRRLQRLRKQGGRLAFVPTMGNLHAGHAQLVRHARSVADHVVVSIFVNPLQFGEGEDYASYPATLDADREVLADLGTDVLFLPGVDDIYPGGAERTAMVVVPVLNKILEGYTTLKEEREKLISQMKEKEKEVEKLKKEFSALKNERSEVRTRIERLIKRLEGIPLDQ